MRTLSLIILCLLAQRGPSARPRVVSELTQLLGRPTGQSIALSVLAPDELEVQVEYGLQSGTYTEKTKPVRIPATTPHEIEITRLAPDTQYFYRLNQRRRGESVFTSGPGYSFHTRRASGSSFTFDVQGDSHPERPDRMYNPALYRRTLQGVESDRPDFYFTLGDDFNVDPLFNRNTLNADTVSQLYINQRGFLGLVGRSAPLFLVNGNHEQAAAALLDGTPESVPVLAGRARNLYYPLPEPNGFYTGDPELVGHLGLRRDYYSFTWGDALFVTLDPYWHSPVQVDEGIGGRGGRGSGAAPRNRDGWAVTMGDAQYQWLRETLRTSQAKYKFVFAHHVNGTGRGAVEIADLFEWGGRNRRGEWEFVAKRPGWEMPVHQLMAKYGVTIFFQGHDHLFARQEKDGVTYQETPNPADASYTAFNREAYTSGDVLPNAGHLRVSVTPGGVRVDYIRAWLPADENAEHRNGETAFTYTVRPK